MHRGSLFVPILLLLLLIVAATPLTDASAAVPSPPPTAPVSLSVSVIPPELPADSNTYHAIVVSFVDTNGRNSFALNSTAVYITSSEQNVGTTVSSITIPAGNVYAIADFTTTTTAGTTIITASALGLGSATASLQTVTPSGFPSHLKVFSVPGSVLATQNYTGGLIVEVQDDTGLPAKAVSDTTVLLSSSDTNVAGLPQKSLVIPAGQIFAFAAYTTSFITGTSFITASSSGFVSGSASVGVVGPAPFALKLYAQPSSMVTCSKGVVSCAGRLMISLTDLSGRPARAPAQISVALRSSNLSVITLPESAVINPGTIYTVVTYQATAEKGTVVLTASVPGLASDFATIKTYPPGGTASLGLRLLAGPDPLLADNQSYRAVVVSIVNKTGFPTVLSNNTSVELTSASSAVGKVDSTIVIPAGQNFGIANFTSTFLPSSTELTASAQNFLPGQVSLTTYGPIPARVVITGVPDILPADGGTYNSLQVMLEDSSGLPAVAPVDVFVRLSSSRADIVAVDSSVTIKAGQVSALIAATTSVLAGSANITATASASGNTNISLLASYSIEKTVTPVPSKLAMYISPAATILSAKANEPVLVVQLQDSNNNPARARQDVAVVVTPSNSTVLASPLTLTIPAGADYAMALFNPDKAGTTVLTASASGLESSSSQILVEPSPLKATITPLTTTMFPNETATVTVTLRVFGAGLKGADVNWSSSSGSLSLRNQTTNAHGQGSVVYTPSGPGTTSVVADVFHPAFGDLNLTATMYVLALPAARGLIDEIVSPLVLVPLGVAIVAVVAVVVIRRRRKGAGGPPEDIQF